MHNLKSLMFNHETGKSFIDKRTVKIATPPLVTIQDEISDDLSTDKLEDLLGQLLEHNIRKLREARIREQAEIRTYRFVFFNVRLWFTGSCRIRVFTNDGDTDYMLSDQIQHYSELDGRMSYDYMMDFLTDYNSCDFEVEASLNFLNTEEGRQTVVSHLIDSIYEKIAGDIARDEYQQWLANEYYYV